MKTIFVFILVSKKEFDLISFPLPNYISFIAIKVLATPGLIFILKGFCVYSHRNKVTKLLELYDVIFSNEISPYSILLFTNGSNPIVYLSFCLHAIYVKCTTCLGHIYASTE